MMDATTLEDMLRKFDGAGCKEPSALERIQKEDQRDKERLEQIQKVARNIPAEKLAEAYYWAHIGYQRLAYENVEIPLSCAKYLSKFAETADAVTRIALEKQAVEENQSRSDVQ